MRQYEDRDLEAVFQIFAQPRCRRFLGREPFTNEAELKAWFDILPKKTIKLVATRADIPVGIGVLGPEGGARAHVGGLSLFVHDRFRRSGIGTLLLQALILSGWRFLGLQRLELIVLCDNEAALNFYEKNGFRIEGRHAGALQYGGQFHDTYMMSLLGRELAIARRRRRRTPTAEPSRASRPLTAPTPA